MAAGASRQYRYYVVYCAEYDTRARELGMVRPGETPYAVRGIKHPAVPPRPADDGTTGVWGFISGIIG